jgi:hypothetical protein
LEEPTSNGEQFLRRMRELLNSISPDDEYYDLARGAARLISEVLDEGAASGPPGFLRQPSSSPEIDAAFDETFSDGTISLLEVLSLILPEELREVLSRGDPGIPLETAVLKKRLLERAQLLKNAERVVTGEEGS